jgi:prepilin-type N-terminal cleavage/methylation domain-containing protein
MKTPNHPFPLHRTAAFTLIELIVVIAIIAILAALIFPIVGALDKKKKWRLRRPNSRRLNWPLTVTKPNSAFIRLIIPATL